MILRSLYNDRYYSYINPFFWLGVLFFLYFNLPAFFSSDINFYYSWNIPTTSIVYANFLVSCTALLFSILLYFKAPRFDTTKTIEISGWIKFFWGVITSYLLIVLAYKILTNNLFVMDYTGTTDTYKIKNLAYLLISISTICYCNSKKIIYFAPNLLIAFLDMAEGSRTTAAIALIPIFICVAIVKRRMFLVPILTIFILMLVVGIVRSSNVISDVPWYLNAIGEFRETYITLPMYILDDKFTSDGTLLSLLSASFFGILQPLRELLLQQVTLSGGYAYTDISRGYGLGSNFLMDSIYYGYSVLVLTLILLTATSVVLYKNIKNSNIYTCLIIVSYMIIFLRLSIREGFYLNLGLTFFLLIFYALPIIAINKFFK